MAAAAVGVDLGAARSRLAVAKEGIVVNNIGASESPSCVAVHDSGLWVGREALRKLHENAPNTIRGVKRCLGTHFKHAHPVGAVPLVSDERRDGPVIHTEHRDFAPEEVVALLLRQMLDLAQSYTKQPVKEAVLVVPAYFNAAQRLATIHAGRIAGLETPHLLNDTSAAALAYASKVKGTKKVLIVDIGAGGGSVSLVEAKQGGIVQVLATAAARLPGGDDIDDMIIEHFKEVIQRVHHVDISTDAAAVEILRKAWQEAKNSLSPRHTMTHVNAFLPDVDFNMMVSLSFLEQDFCRNLLDTLPDRISSVLDQAKVKASAVDDLLLLGGCARLPAVRNAVQRLLPGRAGREPCSSVHPDFGVARGAALHASALQAGAGHALLREVMPLRVLYTYTAGGSARTLCEPGTPLPVKQDVTLLNTQCQPSLLVGVEQTWDSHCSSKRCIAYITVKGNPLPKTPKVTFILKEDGTIQCESTSYDSVLHVQACFGEDQVKDIRMTCSQQNGHGHTNGNAKLEPYINGNVELVSVSPPLIQENSCLESKTDPEPVLTSVSVEQEPDVRQRSPAPDCFSSHDEVQQEPELTPRPPALECFSSHAEVQQEPELTPSPPAQESFSSHAEVEQEPELTPRPPAQECFSSHAEVQQEPELTPTSPVAGHSGLARAEVEAPDEDIRDYPSLSSTESSPSPERRSSTESSPPQSVLVDGEKDLAILRAVARELHAHVFAQDLINRLGSPAPLHSRLNPLDYANPALVQCFILQEDTALQCLAATRLRDVMAEIRLSGRFCVMVDTTVTPERNLVSLIVRYCLPGGDIVERLVALLDVSEATGDVLFDRLVTLCRKHGVDWEGSLCGISLDAHQLTRECYARLLLRLRERLPSLRLVWNGAHRVSELIAQSYGESDAGRACLGTLELLRSFFGVSKRSSVLEQHCPPLASRTVEETVRHVHEHLLKIVEVLDTLRRSDCETSLSADILLALLQEAQFSVHLDLLKQLFEASSEIDACLKLTGGGVSAINKLKLLRGNAESMLSKAFAFGFDPAVEMEGLGLLRSDMLKAVERAAAALELRLGGSQCALRDIGVLSHAFASPAPARRAVHVDLFDWVPNLQRRHLAVEVSSAQAECSGIQNSTLSLIPHVIVSRLLKSCYCKLYPNLFKGLQELCTLPILPGVGEIRKLELLRSAGKRQGALEASMVLLCSADLAPPIDNFNYEQAVRLILSECQF